ncbi:hypothetical protein [Alkaliphilus sp. B6464]|uniref:hypothetical protein n=1 Tax=Alkaliphilus sp. B6464 TaxID=2731219 RepID=UPI002ED04E32
MEDHTGRKISNILEKEGIIVIGVFLPCYLGYELDNYEINNGYITEAIQKWIDIMFNEFGYIELKPILCLKIYAL